MTTTTGTTSSTGSTAAVTAAPAKPSTQNVVSSAATSLLTSLNAGSGVDTNSLVSSLVTAQYASQAAALNSRADTLTTQISGVSTVRNAITTFATALASLVKGGTLQTQPVSSAPGVLSATAAAGAKLSGLSSTITVGNLADRQTAVSAAAFASSAAVVGTGTLTLTLGTATYNADGTIRTFAGNGGDANGDGVDDKAVTIDVGDGKLDTIAGAINGSKAGVTASVITDANGAAYLSLKGATGANQAFTVSSASTSGDLSALDVGIGAAGTRLTSTAQDAALTVDGVAVTRSSNTIGDLVPGVKLQLNSVSAGPVSLTSSTPTEALSGAVSDFVDAYNEVFAILKDQTDPINGALKSDTAAKTLLGSLRTMTTQALTTGGAAGTPTTLAEIGVSTSRNGTLTLKSDTLVNALSNWPASVESMFAYSATSSKGLSALLSGLSTEATNTVYGLGASSANYASAQTALADKQTSLDDRKSAMTTRLTQQFASMNSKVSAYKATQTFLTNQIAAWNKSNN